MAGVLRDHTDRALTDVPISDHPAILQVAVPRFVRRTSDCPRTIFRGGIDHIAPARSVVTARTAQWILQRIVGEKMSVSAVAANLDIA